MRANRGDTAGMIEIAVRESRSHGDTRYLVPTHFGMHVETRPGPSSQPHYRIEPTGAVWRIPSTIERHLDRKTDERIR